MSNYVTIVIRCCMCGHTTAQDVDPHDKTTAQQADLTAALSSWVNVGSSEFMCPACWDRQQRHNRFQNGLPVNSEKPRLDASGRILALAGRDDLNANVRGFLYNCALWAMGMSGLNREALEGYESVPGKELPETPKPAPTEPSPYPISVVDQRRECMTHGGTSMRGSFVVEMRGEVLWTESDVWQPASRAEARCKHVASLLQDAYDQGWRDAREGK